MAAEVGAAAPLSPRYSSSRAEYASGRYRAAFSDFLISVVQLVNEAVSIELENC